MRNRIAFLLLPIALLSVAAKGEGCGGAGTSGAPEADGGSGVSDCPTPEPACAIGTQYSVADCQVRPVPANGGQHLPVRRPARQRPRLRPSMPPPSPTARSPEPRVRDRNPVQRRGLQVRPLPANGGRHLPVRRPARDRRRPRLDPRCGPRCHPRLRLPDPRARVRDRNPVQRRGLQVRPVPANGGQHLPVRRPARRGAVALGHLRARPPQRWKSYTLPIRRRRVSSSSAVIVSRASFGSARSAGASWSR